MTMLGLILDLMLIGLLGTMIFFAVRLHRRLEILRTGRQDLEVLLRDLVTNTATAERNLRDLQSAAQELAPNLQKQVTGARAAREELEFLLGAADAAAEKLLVQISAAKSSARPDMQAMQSEPPLPTLKVPAPPLQAVPPLSAGAPTTKPASASVTPHQGGADESSRRTAEADLLRAIEKLR